MQNSEYSQSYAFTITLLPKFRKLSTKNQLHRTYEYILEFLAPHKVTMVYELTKSYDIHYHGIINFKKDILKDRSAELYWYNKMRKSSTIGYTCLKVITDWNIWVDYLFKSHNEVKAIMTAQTHLNPLLKDSHELGKPNDI